MNRCAVNPSPPVGEAAKNSPWTTKAAMVRVSSPGAGRLRLKNDSPRVVSTVW